MAFLYREQSIVGRIGITQLAFMRNLELDSIAILPLLLRGNNFVHLEILYPGNALELLNQNRPLGFQLEIIGHMLVMTAAANAKVNAARLDALRVRFFNTHQVGQGETPLLLTYTDDGLLTRHDKGHKNRLAGWQPAESTALIY